MKRLFTSLVSLAGSLLLLAANATPTNTTASGAIAYEVGQGWVSTSFDETSQTRWFTFAELPGLSYCIEAVSGSATNMQLDPNLALYSDATGTTTLNVSGTPLTSNDAAGDPYFIKGARICYVAQASGTSFVIRSFKVNTPILSGSGDAGFVKVRVVDTSLHAQCFIRNVYPAAVPSAQVTNLTGTSISGVGRLYGPLVTPASNAVVVPPNSNAGMGFGVSSVDGSGSSLGRCVFAHNGPPGSVRVFVITEDYFSNGQPIRYDMLPRQGN
jgi:hypothetical protein